MSIAWIDFSLNFSLNFPLPCARLPHWPRVSAVALCGLFSAAFAHAAGYDPDMLFPEREGWVQLHPAPDWVNKLRVITPPKRARPIAPLAQQDPAATQQATLARVDSGAVAQAKPGTADPDATAEVTDTKLDPPASMQATEDKAGAGTAAAGAQVTDGVVAVVGSGDNRQAVRAASADAEPQATGDEPEPALAGVRYRILDDGDPTPPSRKRIGDQAHAYLRATAKDLAGNPIGPEGRADDEDSNGVRKVEWEQLPKGLALAVRQMPYHARWEVFIPNSVRGAGKGGAYRILRSRPLIFDVQRLPPA